MRKAKPDKDQSGSKDKGDKFGPVIGDARFSQIHTDARFSIQSKKQAKLQVDNRFKALVKDKRFRIKGKRDPRGFKRAAPEEEEEDLSRLYSFQEEEEDHDREHVQDTNDDSDESSDESSGISDDERENSDPEIVQEWGTALADEEIPHGNATRRIALVHMDWDNIKAVDLLAVLRSFTPSGGSVRKVSIIPTEFGLERMKTEEEKGPEALWKELGGEDDSHPEDDDDDDDIANSEKYNEKLRKYELERFKYFYALAECDSVSTAQSVYDECDGVEFSRTANMMDLRFISDDYEINRIPREVATSVPLEYSAPTFQSNALQHSKVKLTWDTDDVHRSKVLKRRKFTEDEIKEEDFAAFLASDSEDELGEGNEEDDGEQPNNAGNDAQGKRDEKDVAKYKALLGLDTRQSKRKQKDWGHDPAKDSDISSDGEDADNDASEFGDKTVEFSGNIEALVENAMNKKANQEKGVWDQYLEKRKEKKKQKKAKREVGDPTQVDILLNEMNLLDPSAAQPSDVQAQLAVGSSAPEDENRGFDDDFFQENDISWEDAEALQAHETLYQSDPTAKKPAKRKSNRTQANDGDTNKKKEADLELLLMDDSAIREAKKGLRLDPTSNLSDEDDVQRAKNAKVPKSKRKLSKKAKAALKKSSSANDEFKMDLSDTRFQALFTDPNFSIDPTDPQSKRSPGLALISSEKRKRASNSDGNQALPPQSKLPKKQTTPSDDRAVLSAMVKALKRKVAAQRNGHREKSKSKKK